MTDENQRAGAPTQVFGARCAPQLALVGSARRHGVGSRFLQRTAEMGLAVQPDVLKGLAEHKGFRGRGLCARFLYAVPISKLGSREIEPPPVPAWIEREFHARLAELDAIATGVVLTLDDEAHRRFNVFRASHETELGPYGDLHAYADWANKLPGALLRIAGLLHLGELGAEGAAQPITAETIDRVVEFAPYLIGHAKHAVALIHDNEKLELAARCLAWLDSQDETEVKVRDLQRRMHVEIDELHAGLAVLAERQLIRVTKRPARGAAGGRPTDVITVNPRYRVQQEANDSEP
jgi:hypothetical protein